MRLPGTMLRTLLGQEHPVTSDQVRTGHWILLEGCAMTGKRGKEVGRVSDRDRVPTLARCREVAPDRRHNWTPQIPTYGPAAAHPAELRLPIHSPPASTSKRHVFPSTNSPTTLFGYPIRNLSINDLPDPRDSSACVDGVRGLGFLSGLSEANAAVRPKPGEHRVCSQHCARALQVLRADVSAFPRRGGLARGGSTQALEGRIGSLAVGTRALGNQLPSQNQGLAGRVTHSVSLGAPTNGVGRVSPSSGPSLGHDISAFCETCHLLLVLR